MRNHGLVHEDRNALVVFARDPKPGIAKTRLAPALGADGAAALYAAFLSDLALRFGAASVPVWWAVAPAESIEGFALRFGVSRERCFPQAEGDLGDRMRAAFAAARELGAERVTLIGSDTPHLSLDRICEAFARLSESDVVLGPAADGGYYLIAMETPHDVFHDVTWSTPAVLAQTERRAAALGLRVALLAQEFDVDTPEDVERLRKLLENPAVARTMPATSALLRS